MSTFFCPQCRHSFTLPRTPGPILCPACGVVVSSEGTFLTVDAPSVHEDPTRTPLHPPSSNEVVASQGDLLAGHEILDEVGRGAIGVVYRARHLRLGRLVALKLLLAGSHAGKDQLARFKTEAEAIASLSHPHIVQIFEVGEEVDKPFLSLEYCAGGSLEKKLAGHPLPPGEAAALVEKLAHAVAAAHAKHVLHRDLKPANVLLTEDGTPKISDFSLARRLDAAGQTQTGSVLGSPSYMAPEQAQGRKDAGSACDTYSLGAILYECLTGRPPFRAATIYDTLAQVVAEDPVPPRQLNRLVPVDLETITLKCLQKEAARRYASAADLGEDLRRFQADEPIRARPVSRLEHLARFCRRNPRVALLTTSVALLLLFIAGGSFFAALRFEHEQRLARQAAIDADEQRQLAEKERDRAEQAERDGRDKLWSSYLAQARAGRYSGQPGQRFDGLEAIRLASLIRPTTDLRDEGIAVLGLADIREAAKGTRSTRRHGFYGCDFQRDTEKGMAVSREGKLLFRTRPGHVIDWLPSQNGQKLAVHYQVQPGVRRIDLYDEEGDYQRSFEHQEDTCAGWALGDKCYYSTALNGQTHVYDVATGKILRTVRFAHPAAQKSALHPDGKRLAVGWPMNFTVEVYDLETGQREAAWQRTAATFSLAWHPTEPWLLCGGGGSELHEYPSGRSRWSEGHHGHVGVAFTPDGSVCAACGWNGQTVLLDSATGQGLVTVNGAFGGGFLPGNLIQSEHSSTGQWEVASLTHRRSLPTRYFDFGIPADFSPDGRLLALSGGDGVDVIDVATTTTVARLAVGYSESVRFAPGGDAIYTYTGYRGLQRWPLRDLGRGDYRLGPPQSLGVQANGRQYSWLSGNPRGQLIASVWEGNRVVVLDPKDPELRQEFEHFQPRSVALSASGRYAAVGAWKGTRVVVRDLTTGKNCVELTDPLEVADHVTFSPDDRWLAVAQWGQYIFYRVGEWSTPRVLKAKDRNLPCPVAFSGDGKFVVIRHSLRELHLLRADTLERVASIPIPNAASGLALSHDGRQLVVQAYSRVYLWDLGAIRDRLEELKLAFDWPPFAAPAPKWPDKTLKVTVVEGGTALVVPGVVQLPAQGKPAPANELRQWIEQLGGPQGPEAVRRLTEAGPEARKAVEAALAKAVDPHRAPLEDARNHLLLSELLTPRRVRLRFNGATRSDAFAALSRELGVPITLPKEDSANPPPVVRLDLDGVPVWEAVDRLLDATDLRVDPATNAYAADPPLVLVEGKQPPGMVSRQAALRLSASYWTFWRNAYLGVKEQAKEDTLRLGMQLRLDPRQPLARVGTPQVLEATDDQGRSLAASKTSTVLRQGRWQTGVSLPLTVELRTDGLRVGKLKSLKLSVPVRLVTDRRELVRIPLTGKAAGRTGFGPDGVRVTLSNVQNATASFYAMAQITAGQGWTHDANRHLLEVIDAKGRFHPSEQDWYAQRRTSRPEDFLFLGSLLPKPWPGGLAWPGLARGFAPGTNVWLHSTYVMLPPGAGPAAFVVLSETRGVEGNVVFEFRDVPLP